MEVASVSPQLFTTVAQTGELKAKGSTDLWGCSLNDGKFGFTGFTVK